MTPRKIIWSVKEVLFREFWEESRVLWAIWGISEIKVQWLRMVEK